MFYKHVSLVFVLFLPTVGSLFFRYIIAMVDNYVDTVTTLATVVHDLKTF